MERKNSRRRAGGSDYISVRCRGCGAYFDRVRSETWKVRCVPCWKKSKGIEPGEIDRLREENARLRIELSTCQRSKPSAPPGLSELLPDLIRLSHPDRHGGSKLSTRVTAALLAIRRAAR